MKYIFDSCAGSKLKKVSLEWMERFQKPFMVNKREKEKRRKGEKEKKRKREKRVQVEVSKFGVD